MRRNFCEIFNNNTDGVTTKVGGKMIELQREIGDFDGKVAELQSTMVKFSRKNNRVAVGLGKK